MQRQPPVEARPVLRIPATEGAQSVIDCVIAEAPLEVRVFGEPLVTTMRTPGHDRELITGWLAYEGLIASHADVSSLFACGDPKDEDFGNVYEVVPAAGMAERLKARDPELQPRVIQSSCGVCGRQTVADLLQRRSPAQHTASWDVATLRHLFELCGTEQTLFRRTGATHCAVLGHRDETVDLTREDVGRHNAVDKLVGRLLLDRRLPVTDSDVLIVSSRASFEIVHKALMAGFSVILSVSAPSTLAVDLAERAGMVLAGFYRSGSFNIYAGAGRVRA